MFVITPADKSYRVHAWVATLAVVSLVYWRRTVSPPSSYWGVSGVMAASVMLHVLSLRSLSCERSSALRLTLPADEYCQYLRYRYVARPNLVRDFFIQVIVTCALLALTAGQRRHWVVRIAAWVLEKHCWYKVAVYTLFLNADAPIQAEIVREEPQFKLETLDVGREWTLVEGMSTKKLVHTWVRRIDGEEAGADQMESAWELKVTVTKDHWQYDADRPSRLNGQVLRISRPAGECTTA